MRRLRRSSRSGAAGATYLPRDGRDGRIPWRRPACYQLRGRCWPICPWRVFHVFSYSERPHTYAQRYTDHGACRQWSRSASRILRELSGRRRRRFTGSSLAVRYACCLSSVRMPGCIRALAITYMENWCGDRRRDRESVAVWACCTRSNVVWPLAPCMAASRIGGCRDACGVRCASWRHTTRRTAALAPRDVYKLIYQAVFGPEHSIDNLRAAMERLYLEVLHLPDTASDDAGTRTTLASAVVESICSRLCSRGSVRALWQCFRQTWRGTNPAPW